MVGITAESVMTLVEDKLLWFNVATVNHVAHTVRKEVSSTLLLAVFLDMDSTVASAVETPLPLPAGRVKRAIVFVNFTHESIDPFAICD
jgi:hypothetical protein